MGEIEMIKTIKIMFGLLCLLSGCAVKTTATESLESLPIGFYEGSGFFIDHDRRLVLINTGRAVSYTHLDVYKRQV